MAAAALPLANNRAQIPEIAEKFAAIVPTKLRSLNAKIAVQKFGARFAFAMAFRVFSARFYARFAVFALVGFPEIPARPAFLPRPISLFFDLDADIVPPIDEAF